MSEPENDADALIELGATHTKYLELIRYFLKRAKEDEASLGAATVYSNQLNKMIGDLHLEYYGNEA